MDISKVKEGRVLSYKTHRGTIGRGRVIEVTRKLTGWWVILEDKQRARAVTLRPSQLYITNQQAQEAP